VQAVQRIQGGCRELAPYDGAPLPSPGDEKGGVDDAQELPAALGTQRARWVSGLRPPKPQKARSVRPLFTSW
jgi:hypothetical protein